MMRFASAVLLWNFLPGVFLSWRPVSLVFEGARLGMESLEMACALTGEQGSRREEDASVVQCLLFPPLLLCKERCGVLSE